MVGIGHKEGFLIIKHSFGLFKRDLVLLNVYGRFVLISSKLHKNYLP